MFNFLGRGSAYYTEEKNTSAFLIENRKMLLIDCGETVFSSLMEFNLFAKIDEIYILFTHTHSDHIGSLGSLIYYFNFKKKHLVNIIVNKNIKYFDSLKNILKIFDLNDSMYNFIGSKESSNQFESINNIEFVETKHSENINCYGFKFYTDKGIVYYSGDSNNAEIIENLLNSKEKVYRIYTEITNIDYLSNCHSHINLLNKVIPQVFRNKIYCMHFSNKECIENAKTLGFNIVKLVKKEEINKLILNK